MFQKHFPEVHWQPIETGGTGRGIPDTNYCFGGIEGWVEFKLTSTWTTGLRPEQIAWLLRRARAGGRTFIAIRRKHSGGLRKGLAEDQLYLFPGTYARDLVLKGHRPIGDGGPARWPWAEIKSLLLS